MQALIGGSVAPAVTAIAQTHAGCADMSTRTATALSAVGYRSAHTVSTGRGPSLSMRRPRYGATSPSPRTYSALDVPASANEPDLPWTKSRIASPETPIGMRPTIEDRIVTRSSG